MILGLIFGQTSAGTSLAATSQAYESEPLIAHIITAQDGIAPDVKTITAGLHLKLGEDWKTYWKSPGEVGIPPKITWNGSQNVSDVQFHWPAPIRFRAFGIENFGYKDEVVFPLTVTLENPGAPVDLKAAVTTLICSDICVPVEFSLDLSLTQGTGRDQDSARLINAFLSRVPTTGNTSGMKSDAATLDTESEMLTLNFTSDLPFDAPDVFPDMGRDTAFGAPDIRLAGDRRQLWVQFPVLALAQDPPALSVTVTDTNRVAEFSPRTDAPPTPPPYEIAAAETSASALVWIILLAVGGGLILNVMPCVLPVLSIKLSSAVKARDRSAAQIRAGFLASAAGILTFMWLLAAITIAARSLGYSVGWGIQFQNPLFLAVMIVVLAVFATSLAGLFEILACFGSAVAILFVLHAFVEFVEIFNEFALFFFKAFEFATDFFLLLLGLGLFEHGFEFLDLVGDAALAAGELLEAVEHLHVFACFFALGFALLLLGLALCFVALFFLLELHVHHLALAPLLGAA